MDFLKGKKTYIIALLIGLLSAAKALGYVDEGTFQTVMALLTGGGLAALRHANDSTNEDTQ
jgi:uncharacterized membrane protein